MNRRDSRIIGSLVVAVASLAFNGTAQTTEVISDGGFESVLTSNGNTQPVPYSFGQWASHVISDASVGIVTSPVHGGSAAAQVDTRAASRGGYVYQDITNIGTCFTWRFFVWRGEGVNYAEVLSVWDRILGSAYAVSSVVFSDTGLGFYAWNAYTNFNLVLASNAWHEVVVEADGNSRKQELFVDGERIGCVESLGELYGAGTVILGDVASYAEHGLYVYDDMSLRASTCPGTDLAVAMNSSPTIVVPGQQIAFTLSVTNKGDLPASGVMLTNVLPANATFVSVISSQGNCTQSLGTVVCSLGSIGVGSNATISIAVTPTAIGLATNGASVMAYEPDLNPADNATSAVVSVVAGPLSEIHLYAGITVYGLVGETYGIQYTTDLNQGTNWIGLTNVTLSAPSFLWYDSQPAWYPQRFYKVVPGPIPVP